MYFSFHLLIHTLLYSILSFCSVHTHTHELNRIIPFSWCHLITYQKALLLLLPASVNTTQGAGNLFRQLSLSLFHHFNHSLIHLFTVQYHHCHHHHQRLINLGVHFTTTTCTFDHHHHHGSGGDVQARPAQGLTRGGGTFAGAPKIKAGQRE